MISRKLKGAYSLLNLACKANSGRYVEPPQGSFAQIYTAAKTENRKLWSDQLFDPPESREKIHFSAPRQLVVTASGPDKPGIVSRLSKIILESCGNLEESRMARLAGDFSIIMLITVDSEVPKVAEDLAQKLSQVDSLKVTTRWTEDDRVNERKPRRKFRRISLVGADNPGIVYNVAEYLASNKINIENLETSTQEAPFGGATLFTMNGIIAMPIGFPTKKLTLHLDCLQSNLGVEITVANLDPAKREEDFRDWSESVLVHGRSKYAAQETKKAEFFVI